MNYLNMAVLIKSFSFYITTSVPSSTIFRIIPVVLPTELQVENGLVGISCNSVFGKTVKYAL